MTNIRVNPNIGCKYPATIRTDNHDYVPKGMTPVILFGANSYANRTPNTRKFMPRLTVNRDPNEGEARAR